MQGLVDTHCHLDAIEFEGERDEVILRAHSSGVGIMVVPAVEHANLAAVARLCEQYSSCVPAYGIHPLYAGRAQPEDLLVVRDYLHRSETVAVGEIGLDFFVDSPDVACQEFYFREQLKMARDLGLPVILHVRRAVDAILKHLRAIGVSGGIAHAFNGSTQQAGMLIDLNIKLGFGGAMTYDRALRIRELARILPLESIVLETDAPDIPPSWLGRGCNAPAELPRIAQVLADLRGLSLKQVIEATTRNALEALPKMKPLESAV